MSKFMLICSIPYHIIFHPIWPFSGQLVSFEVVSLTGPLAKLTMSPDGGTLFSYIPDTPLSNQVIKFHLQGGVIKLEK